jgi:allantoinase
MPGVVDTHVHINEPGRTEWEGFESATRAAAAGGITTLVDMPLNSLPPATSARGWTKGRDHGGPCSSTWACGAAPCPENTRGRHEGLAKVLAAARSGFKCFLVPSGVDEFPYVREDDVRAALVQLHGTGRGVHGARRAARAHRRRRAERWPPRCRRPTRVYRNYVRSRPRAAEDEAVELLYRLCKEIGTPVHVVHLSSSGALGTLASARDEGVPLTAETAPHYLHFTAEDVPDGATWYKCAPPIRERDNQERLWAACKTGSSPWW